MRFSKIQTYFFLFGCFIVICLIYQAFWLISSTTTGQIISFGKGSGDYRAVENIEVCYWVTDREYHSFFLRNGIPDTATVVPVRYFILYPEMSRLNTPSGTWGFVLVMNVIVFLSLTIIFFTPDIISKDSGFIIGGRFPFIRIERLATESKLL